MNIFDFLNDINDKKVGIMTPENEKVYVPFIINRGLSYFSDTVMIANELNRYPSLDKKLQFDFLINTVRKRKRFSKWHKSMCSDDVKVIMNYYDYNPSKAEAALKLLSKDQIDLIKRELEVSHE